MKTYNFKRGEHWDSTDYPPYGLDYQPTRKEKHIKARREQPSFRRMLCWLLAWIMLAELILLFWPLAGL